MSQGVGPAPTMDQGRRWVSPTGPSVRHERVSRSQVPSVGGNSGEGLEDRPRGPGSEARPALSKTRTGGSVRHRTPSCPVVCPQGSLGLPAVTWWSRERMKMVLILARLTLGGRRNPGHQRRAVSEVPTTGWCRRDDYGSSDRLDAPDRACGRSVRKDRAGCVPLARQVRASGRPWGRSPAAQHPG